MREIKINMTVTPEGILEGAEMTYPRLWSRLRHKKYQKKTYQRLCTL